VRIPRTRVVIVNQAAGIPVLMDVSMRPSGANVADPELLDGLAPGIKARYRTQGSNKAMPQSLP
jgi:hypothetical protein